MRIILAGQKSFGAAALDALLRADFAVDVPFVVTRPEDKLDYAAERSGIRARYTLDAADVAAVDADLILCAHSHDFVGRKSRDATQLGALVGHPSLLPRHRGKSAVEWTIRMNDPIAGFTWFWADNNVDTGPIARQAHTHVVPGWDHHDLWEVLFPLGVSLMVRTLRDIAVDRRVVAIPQDERAATREPAIEPTRLYRPELPAIGSGPAGYEYIASSEDPRLCP